MSFSILPKEEKFFKLFEAQAAYNTKAVKAFKELVKNWDEKSAAFEVIREIEHEADITTHEIYDKLNRTFITPFDREDIHQLASEMDDIVDLVQSVCNRMLLYHVKATTPDLEQLVDILDQATDAIRKAVCELQNKDKARRVLDYIDNGGSDDACMASRLKRLKYEFGQWLSWTNLEEEYGREELWMRWLHARAHRKGDL